MTATAMSVVEQRALPKVALDPTPVRYMGTKRALGPVVRDEIVRLRPVGRAADLFSGMGSVAQSLAGRVPVLTNDTLRFTGAFARARFTNYQKPNVEEVGRELTEAFDECRKLLRARYAARIRAEERAQSQGHDAFAQYMARAPHVGKSQSWSEAAAECRLLKSAGDYRLATLYFSSAYLSTAQAIDLDALRYAIDRRYHDQDCRDWILSAWISAAAVVLNTPGHTAQFLKPTSTEVAFRVGRQWRRSIWETFIDRLRSIAPLGTREWRAGTVVTAEDALTLVDSDVLDSVGVVYADPPYTKDHYSRFYHVYETLYLYDFPDAAGSGRYRSDRFFGTFSLVSGVESAFDDLARKLAARGKPLVLSYPTNGVLQKAGSDPRSILERYYTIAAEIEVALQHSTLGASSGTQRKNTLEKLYVCKP